MSEQNNVSEVQPPFKLERYFAQFEFSTRFLLSASDPESVSLKELLELADDECMKLWDDLSLGYTEMRGHPLLLEEAANVHGLKPENILVSAPQEAIYLVSKILANQFSKENPGTVHVVATFPAYQSLYQNLATFGCTVDYWQPRYNHEDSSWAFHLEDLQKVIKDNTALLVINFPHNPTGYLPPDEDFHRLIQLCRERNIFVFSDEMYRFTNSDGTEPFPSVAQLYEKSLSLFGVSKTFGLPGLRIGWMASQDADLLERIEKLKDYVTMCSSAPSEILAIIALRSRKALIGRTVAHISRNLDHLDAFMQRHRSLFAWHRPRASTMAFVRLKPAILQRFSKVGDGSDGAEAFCTAVREEAEVLLLPATVYNFTDHFLRLGFGRANLPDALRALETFISKNGLD